MDNFYDPTAGNVITPEGVGKYIRHDTATGMVQIEFDYAYRKWFDVSQCYLD